MFRHPRHTHNAIALETIPTKGQLKLPVYFIFLFAALFSSTHVLAEDIDTDRLLLSPPQIIKNPNQHAPLAAIVHLETSAPVIGWIEVTDGERRSKFDIRRTEGGSIEIPIFGFRPGRTHQIFIHVRKLSEQSFIDIEPLNYTADPLSKSEYSIPPVIVKYTNPAEMEPGYTLLSVRRSPLVRDTQLTAEQRKFTLDWGMLLVLDASGEVVWYYKSDIRIAGVTQLNNGNILCTLADFRMVEIDWLGNIVQQWYASSRVQGTLDNAVAVSAKAIHHQPFEMPSGNFLAFSAVSREVENFYTSETDPKSPRKTALVMGDKVIEFNRKGTILWSWDTFDYLDPYRIGYNTINRYWDVRGFPDHMDWTHGNGLTYDHFDDSIIISLRNQDAIIKIDRKSREIVWILGERTGWPVNLKKKLLKKDGHFRWPYHSHNPNVTGKDKFIIMDNGPYQARPFNQPIPPYSLVSRAVEFKVDKDTMTVSQIWSTENLSPEDQCNNFAMGDAHRLPQTGNTLVLFAMCFDPPEDLVFDLNAVGRHFQELPMYARIREYRKETNKVVFDVELNDPHDVIGWQVYGGFRFSAFPGQTAARNN